MSALAKYTMFFGYANFTPRLQYYVYLMIHVVNNRILEIFMAFDPVLNMLLYVDLFWIMRDPFLPQKKRYRVYNAIIFVVFNALLIIELIKMSLPMDNNLKN